jgi:hypothetical protein
MVLQGEERVKTERLGQVPEGHVFGEYRRIGAPGLGEHVQCDADFHESPPSYRLD